MIMVTNSIEQKVTSAGTSINSLNGAYKQIEGKYPIGTVIFDYGCGKYNTNRDFAIKCGYSWFGYDPYNRTKEENMENIAHVKERSYAPDIVMLNNVLNVIDNVNSISNILSDIYYNYADNNTDIYITIYEGDKSGIGKVTSKGYQRNEKLSKYTDYICEFFDVVEKVGSNIYKCRKVV